MAFADMADLAEHPGFRARVRIAMVTAAVQIGAEIADGSEHDRLRRALSVNVLLDQYQYGDRFAWTVATNPAITLASPDDALQFTVNSQWDAVAGAGPVPA